MKYETEKPVAGSRRRRICEKKSTGSGGQKCGTEKPTVSSRQEDWQEELYGGRRKEFGKDALQTTWMVQEGRNAGRRSKWSRRRRIGDNRRFLLWKNEGSFRTTVLRYVSEIDGDFILSLILLQSNAKFVLVTLISQAAERLYEISVRKNALQKLLKVYRDYCGKCSKGQLTINDDFEHIPCKVLVLCNDKDCKQFRSSAWNLFLWKIYSELISLLRKGLDTGSIYSLFSISITKSQIRFAAKTKVTK